MTNSNNFLSKSTFGFISGANIKQIEEAKGYFKLLIFRKKKSRYK
jgi:hypothetical protein